MKITNTHVTINVSDLDNSITFYQSIGFDVSQRWGNHYAQLCAPGISIGLHPAAQTSTDKSSAISIGLTVEDFNEVCNHLTEYGITYQERKEEGGEFIHFADPDGNPLYVIKQSW